MFCKIYLHNPRTYSPGDTIKGKVQCKFETRQSVKAIICKLIGKELTHWTGRGSNYEERDLQYSGENLFLALSTSLGPEHTAIKPGVYDYTFQFKLPSSEIPSSYLHSYGSVDYTMSVTIHTPLSSHASKDEVELFVLAPVISDDRPLFPVTNQNEEENVVCCFPVLPTILCATLEKDTFALGENMRLRVDLDNKCDVEVTALSVELVSIIQFKVNKPHVNFKYTQDKVVNASEAGLAAGGKKVYQIYMKIPQTTTLPSFEGCTLLKQWCSLTVAALFPRHHASSKLETYITDIKLCNKSSPNNSTNIGFSQNVVPALGATFASNVVPVAQAPSVVYPPPNNNPPYPLGDPIGHPLHPMPHRSSTIDDDIPASPTAPLINHHSSIARRATGYPPSTSSGYPPPPTVPSLNAGYPPPPTVPSLNVGYPPPPTVPSLNAGYPPPPTVPSLNAGYPPPPTVPALNAGYPPPPRVPSLNAGYPPPPTVPSLNAGYPPPPTVPSRNSGYPPPPKPTPSIESSVYPPYPIPPTIDDVENYNHRSTQSGYPPYSMPSIVDYLDDGNSGSRIVREISYPPPPRLSISDGAQIHRITGETASIRPRTVPLASAPSGDRDDAELPPPSYDDVMRRTTLPPS